SAQIAALATGLRIKGETATEVTGLVKAMLAAAAPLEIPGPLLDPCGPGGDRAGTFNVSTLTALVAVGAGQRVVKHGNRAMSGRCGSADLLEALGIAITLPPEGVAATVAEVGIGFCFAPVFHPAMRHATSTRRELGVPTVFNFLGPLTNPARAAHQALGVADPRMAPIMAEVLRRTGIHHALVFYGHDGLDELTTTTTSTLLDVSADGVRELDGPHHGRGPAAPRHPPRPGVLRPRRPRRADHHHHLDPARRQRRRCPGAGGRPGRAGPGRRRPRGPARRRRRPQRGHRQGGPGRPWRPAPRHRAAEHGRRPGRRGRPHPPGRRPGGPRPVDRGGPGPRRPRRLGRELPPRRRRLTRVPPARRPGPGQSGWPDSNPTENIWARS